MPHKDPQARREYHKQYMREWYQKNKQKQIKMNCTWRKNRKTEIRQWLLDSKIKLSCEQCGENHPACLDFHHKDPSQKDFAIGTALSSGYSRERILEEIKKCRVLCANCHRKLHWSL